jgi:DNA (cytosine-5)-methyltransferase 1
VNNLLVLSVFPGIGLLDRAFEAEGFCVVRGPDPIWGGDVRSFHPPAGAFGGVIGGPPCQRHSQLNAAVRGGHREPAEDLIPEFERVVAEAHPDWFLMENVRQAPLPEVRGYRVHAQLLNNRWCGGVQNRVRRFSFGTRNGRRLKVPGEALEPVDRAPCFTANATQWEAASGRSRSCRTRAELRRGLRLQGLPEDALDGCPFTVAEAIRAVGNGVPIPLGRAVARAVWRAL